MKVQIIQLDAYDDYISTRDKMGWIQTGRIILVLPPRGRILVRKLDLILLQRHSKALGVIFALVTSDPDVIYHANQLGIPIFNNVRQALESPWRGKRRRLAQIQHDHSPINLDELRENSPHHSDVSTQSPRVRIGAFIISLIALLALVSLFIPKARLTLIPNQKTQVIQLPVTALPLFTDVSIAGEIPAHILITLVEGKEEIKTTGKVQIPDQYAMGEVRFTNLSEDHIEIPIGTIVSTLGSNPIRFKTTKTGEISGEIGMSVALPIKAHIPGQTGNVPAQSILAIEGPLGLSLSVVNPMPAHYGSQTTVPAASAQDVSTLHEKLLSTLEDEALSDLKSQLDPDDLIVDDTLTVVKIIEENYDPPKDQPTNQLELTLQIVFQVLYIEGKDINILANQVLDANLPDGYQATPDTLEIKPVNQPTIDKDGTLKWKLLLKRDILAKIDPSQAINMILGLPKNQASQSLIDRYALIEAPIITLTPKWWPRIPFLPFRVYINTWKSP